MNVFGLDIGTANLVSAFLDKEENVKFKHQRDAYIQIDRNKYTDKILKENKVQYAEYQGKSYVLGTDAFEIANVFNRECQRPMKDGVISHSEREALPMIELLIKSIVGNKGGKVCFSIPAKAVDSDTEIFYHQGVFDMCLKNLGFETSHINEGQAVVFAELNEEKYSGIAISCGAGLTNIAVSCMGTEAVSFSVQRAADWVHKQVSTILGMPASRVAAEIEDREFNICKPNGEFEVAVALTYRSYLAYVIDLIHKQIVASGSVPYFKEAVPVVCAGGTSMATGFVELFKSIFDMKDFPIKISGIRHAKNPFYSVAEGCLYAALSEEE